MPPFSNHSASVLTCHVQPDGRILSPAVGRFYPISAPFGMSKQAIGILERLGKRYQLIVPQSLTSMVPVLSSGTFVVVGDVIAQMNTQICRRQPENIQPSTHHSISILAPASGFLILKDENGMPFQSEGKHIQYGDMIAILEFMKIRMEITYDGPEPAVFEHYLKLHQSSVEKSQTIATCLRT
jgi:hypothetical protein